MAIGAAIGTAVGGLASASAARRAASSQEQAANNSIAFQTETRDLIRNDMQPFVGAGRNALNALNFEMGLGSQPANYNGFEQTPGYQFALDQGLGAVEASAAARGGLYSGAAMEALQERGQGIGQQYYGQHLDRLTGLAGSGQNAAAGMAAVNQNTANAVSNSYSDIGNAQSAGAIGQANALNGAINNGIGIWGYQNALNNQGGNGGGGFFGGFGQ